MSSILRTGTGQRRVGAGTATGGDRRSALLVGAGILLVALNLRPAIGSIGPVIDRLQADLSMSGTVAGLLTTLPALCFGAFSGLTPGLVRRFGARRVLLVAMAAVVAGQAVRPFAGSAVPFILASVVCLAGIAAGNVTLPALVRAHFPDRIGLVTGLYTTVLNLGTALASALVVPAAQVTGGWRGGLAVWACVAVLGLLPWLGALRSRRSPTPTGHLGGGTTATVRPSRTRLGWALAVYMGTQSLQAYVIFGWLAKIFQDSGYSPGTAGLLVSLVTGIGMPIALFLPGVAARSRDQRPYVGLLVACYVVGYSGLLLAPHAALLWALLLGVGGGAFPLSLLMIGLRSRTAGGTASLSAFAQSIGYLIAAAGPVLVGFLYDATGGWTVPVVTLLVILVPQAVNGMMAGRNRYLEDEGPARGGPVGAES